MAPLPIAEIPPIESARKTQAPASNRSSQLGLSRRPSKPPKSPHAAKPTPPPAAIPKATSTRSSNSATRPAPKYPNRAQAADAETHRPAKTHPPAAPPPTSLPKHIDPPLLQIEHHLP